MRITWNRACRIAGGPAAFALLAFVTILGAMSAFGGHPTAPPMSTSVIVRVENGQGSGTHIGAGKILTAAHVVGDATSAKVITRGGEEFDAQVTWRDADADLALVQMFAEMPSATVYCGPVAVGDAITIIGSPGPIKFLTNRGFISAPAEKRWQFASALMMDASVAKGMSGGGVFDSRGRLVAVAVAIYGMGLGGSQSGISYAVPVKRICKGVM